MFFGDLPTSSSSSNSTTSKSNLLSDLPSSGNLLEVEDSTTSGEFSKYLCLHNTAPEQEIKTDTTTMLIRSFSLKKRNRKKKSSSSTKRGKKRKKASSSSSDSSIRFDGGKRKKQSKTTSSSSNDKKASRNRRLELACLRESLQRQGLDTVGTESELRLRLRQHHEESTEQQRVRLTAEHTTNNTSEREYWDIEF